jgi:hypothetical protein
LHDNFKGAKEYQELTKVFGERSFQGQLAEEAKTQRAFHQWNSG